MAKGTRTGGKQFTSGYQPKKNGRRKSKLKGLIDKCELSSDDISDLIKTLFDKTENELIEYGDDAAKPFLMRAFCKALIKDMDQGGIYNINSLLDRSIGKVTDKVELTVDTKTIDDLRAKYENK